NSPRALQLKAIQELADSRVGQTAQRVKEEDEEKKPVQGKFEAGRKKAENPVTQRIKEEEEEKKPVQGKFNTVQKQPQAPETGQKNNTGLPGTLKAGVEKLSGTDMSDVKVHYNSDKPSQLQAHAYAQGTDIHLAPGQEKHLPHETWHVAQQKQGRVKPTRQLKSGVRINDDNSLEKEADVKGKAALQAMFSSKTVMQAKGVSGSRTVQRNEEDNQNEKEEVPGDYLKLLADIKGLKFYWGEEHKIWYEIENEKLIKDKKSYKKYAGKEHAKYREQWESLILGFVPSGKPKETEEKGLIDEVDDRLGKITSPIGELIGYEGISGVSDKLLGRTVKTGSGGKDDISKKDKRTATRMGGVSDTITGLKGVIGFVKGFKDLTDPDKKVSDHFETFLTTMQSGSGIVESGSKLKTTLKGGKTSGKLGASFESFGAGLGAIKEAFLAMKKIFSALPDSDELSGSEKKKGLREGIFHALESAKSVVLSVKAYYELATGSASGKLMSLVPGAGIAVAALKL
ncbi:MAG: DUF4157 domain-containing protein, partial [Sinomicrobium sp.]|nr:DUF4157 domain-containing protein [Sinomicrobium sp.]